MSLREKQLWISLVAGAVIWIAYAAWAAPILADAAHPHPARATGTAFLCALAAFVAAEAVLGGVVAAFQRRHRPAQDRGLTEAGLVGGQLALLVLVGLMVVLLFGLWAASAGMEAALNGFSIGTAIGPRAPLLIAHYVLFALILSGGVRALTTLLLVRRRR